MTSTNEVTHLRAIMDRLEAAYAAAFEAYEALDLYSAGVVIVDSDGTELGRTAGVADIELATQRLDRAKDAVQARLHKAELKARYRRGVYGDRTDTQTQTRTA